MEKVGEIDGPIIVVAGVGGAGYWVQLRLNLFSTVAFLNFLFSLLKRAQHVRRSTLLAFLLLTAHYSLLLLGYSLPATCCSVLSLSLSFWFL